MSETEDVGSSRSFGNMSEQETMRFNLDLVAAARYNLSFLRLVADSAWLHHKSTILESIRRYDQLWMPLISDYTVVGQSSTPPRLLPPFDVEWVWFCHTLNPVSYREYCESRFSKLIGKAPIFDEENEEYAVNRCREIWEQRYPSEPFENEIDTDSGLKNPVEVNEDILNQVLRQRCLYAKFSEPFRCEVVYLIAARERYKGFLCNMNRIAEKCSHLVPTSDILLMLLTHQSYPSAYAVDCKEFEGHIRKLYGVWDDVKEEVIEETKLLWEEAFDEPYEKAGSLAVGRSDVKPPLYWDVTDADVNTKYKSLMPRFLLEFCLSVKLEEMPLTMKKDISKEFLRLRLARCHKELKLDKPVVEFKSGSWHKAWHLYCEFGTRGAILELREEGGHWFKRSGKVNSITFIWNDLLRTHSLSMSKKLDQAVQLDASITPPVQAPYLLKCLADRVTDDSGTMVSDVILKMNRYRPQEGRWLSRTVLDHAGRESFVIRMRMGGGIWRRGGETPSAVKWEDRITEIREGCWSYVAGSIGTAPEKVVGTATPQEPPQGWQALWNLSTGDELLVRRGSTTSTSGFIFEVKNKSTTDTMVKLLKGRKMQYQVPKDLEVGDDEPDKEQQEDGFVTLVRISEEYPSGKATALLNWRLLTIEVQPEEDVVLGLLLCISIVRSITEIEKEDVANLLMRRRMKQPKSGERDWGSVMLHPASPCSPRMCSPLLQPWYWNANAVFGSKMVESASHSVAAGNQNHNSPAEGGDKLYKKGIFA